VKSVVVRDLDRAIRSLAKAKPGKAHPALHGAFLGFAAAGELEHAAAVIRLAYDARLPRPSELINVFGTGPMDAVCAVAGLGDLTGGVPVAGHLVGASGLADRVRLSARFVRGRIIRDAFAGPRAPGHWSTLEGLDLWREIQHLAGTADEAETFAAVCRYMDAWCTSPSDRGAGYGNDFLLAVDLAVRRGAMRELKRWTSALGRHHVGNDVRIGEALCLTGVAGAIGNGLFAATVALSKADAAQRMFTIEEAVSALVARAQAPHRPGFVTSARRQVSAHYSQFSLEHETSSADEVFFQDEREHAQGMSIFVSKVGIATPADTGTCTVTIELRGDRSPAGVEGAVQAVAFPFTVTGPIFVRSVVGSNEDGDEDEDVVLPHGEYDVLARFFPARASAKEAQADLRAFRVALDFHPAGALAAPRCFELENGRPPETIFVSGR
jgi:hypothetical protein